MDLKLFQKGEVLKNHFVTGVPKWIPISKLGGSVRVNFAGTPPSGFFEFCKRL